MVRTMTRLFIGQLPGWARRDHPVLRHELGTSARARWQVRYARAFGVVLGGGGLLLVGYLIATNLLRRSAGQTAAEVINAVLFYPLLLI